MRESCIRLNHLRVCGSNFLLGYMLCFMLPCVLLGSGFRPAVSLPLKVASHQIGMQMPPTVGGTLYMCRYLQIEHFGWDTGRTNHFEKRKELLTASGNDSGHVRARVLLPVIQ